MIILLVLAFALPARLALRSIAGRPTIRSAAHAATLGRIDGW